MSGRCRTDTTAPTRFPPSVNTTRSSGCRSKIPENVSSENSRRNGWNATTIVVAKPPSPRASNVSPTWNESGKPPSSIPSHRPSILRPLKYTLPGGRLGISTPFSPSALIFATSSRVASGFQYFNKPSPWKRSGAAAQNSATSSF